MKQPDDLIIFIVIINIILLVFVVGIFIFIMQYRRRKLETEKEKELIRKEHQQQLLEMQFEIQSQTMQEIGREIHDNVGQKLTLASLYTQQLDYDNQYPEIHERINTVSNVINESLSELRALSKNLTNQYIEQLSLNELLQNELERIKTLFRYNVDTKIDCKKEYSTLTKTIIFRIAQEFFQNSIKHSKADTLTLTLEQKPEYLSLFLKDNGKGFIYDNEKNYAGIGLSNMKKRAALIGAAFDIKSMPDKGTELTLKIPNENI